MRSNSSILFAVIVCLSVDDVMAQSTADPFIQGSSIVFDQGNGGVCPSVLRGSDGGLIAYWASAGDGMPSASTLFARSADMGKTWSSPYLNIGSSNPRKGISTSLYNLPSGQQLRATMETSWPSEPNPSAPNYLQLCEGRTWDTYYSFSTNDGVTATPRTLVTSDDPVNRDFFPQGGITKLANGDLLWAWGRWNGSPVAGFKRSTDGGQTWGATIPAWQDPPPGHSTPLAFNENATTVCQNGVVVSISRVDSLSDQAHGYDRRFWQIESYDNGSTWTAPHVLSVPGGASFQGQSPALYSTVQGKLLFAYRDMGKGPGVGLAASDNNGATWRYLGHLKDPKGYYESSLVGRDYTAAEMQTSNRGDVGTWAGYPAFVKVNNHKACVVFHTLTNDLPGAGGNYGPYIASNTLVLPSAVLFDSFDSATSGSAYGYSGGFGRNQELSTRQSGAAGTVSYSYGAPDSARVQINSVPGKLTLVKCVDKPEDRAWVSLNHDFSLNATVSATIWPNYGDPNDSSMDWAGIGMRTNGPAVFTTYPGGGNLVTADGAYGTYPATGAWIAIQQNGTWTYYENGGGETVFTISGSSGPWTDSYDLEMQTFGDELTATINGRMLDLNGDLPGFARTMAAAGIDSHNYIALNAVGCTGASSKTSAFDNLGVDGAGIGWELGTGILPIPEPNSTILLGTALIGLLVQLRRKRSNPPRHGFQRP
jgi:hypothetical protein